MRFIPVESLKEGMCLGKSLLGRNCELLLKEGTTLVDSYIQKIRQLGYSGVYIEDDLSGDIQVSDVIDENLRFETIRSVKDVFSGIEQSKASPLKVNGGLDKLVGDIVDNILDHTDTLVNIIDLKLFDDYTFYHSVNVCILSIVMGTALKLDKPQLCNLGMSAILHDMGKTFIPKEILNKNGRLTEEEFALVKDHSLKGYNYIKDNTDVPAPVYVGILHHHEKYCGDGYPTGISGNKINLFGRIVSITDVYDAITSDRPYRRALPSHEAVEFIMGNGGIAFDPELVKVFSQKIAPYPTGSCVQLSNGCTGLVVQNYPDCCTRPKIKVISQHGQEVSPFYIDLKNDTGHIGTVIQGIV